MAAASAGGRLVCRCSAGLRVGVAGPSTFPANASSNRSRASAQKRAVHSRPSANYCLLPNDGFPRAKIGVCQKKSFSCRRYLKADDATMQPSKPSRRHFHSSSTRSATKNPYQALGVNKSASASEIKKAYYQVRCKPSASRMKPCLMSSRSSLSNTTPTLTKTRRQRRNLLKFRKHTMSVCFYA